MRNATEHFRASLESATATLWWPGLASELVLGIQVGADAGNLDALKNYTTSNYLSGLAPIRVDRVQPPTGRGPELRIECLPPSLVEMLSERGVSFLDASETSTPLTRAALESASELIGVSSSLATSVQQMARSIHLLRQIDPCNDISFSDPGIPFSIFVSISLIAKNGALRLAEAIIHESMHLQLSLIERIVPLAAGDGELHYSPWKQSKRPVAGLVHAMYVFGVIHQWLDQIGISEELKPYALRRQAQIEQEVRQTDFAALLTQVTPDGEKLLKRVASAVRHR